MVFSYLFKRWSTGASVIEIYLYSLDAYSGITKGVSERCYYHTKIFVKVASIRKNVNHPQKKEQKDLVVD